MARIEKTIFISYRRKDISWALAVYQYLTSQKYNVFFDFSSLSSGDFEQVIVSNIKARAHFVLILTPTALDRCNEPGDWLRREIEIAVDEKRNIIPLFFDGFNFGVPSIAEKLTGKLGAINRYNGLDIPYGYFMEAMERLSNRYLNVPLDAVIHPVSTEVRKVVKEEQVAADKALVQQKEDIKELVKPAEEKPAKSPYPRGSGAGGEGGQAGPGTEAARSQNISQEGMAVGGRIKEWVRQYNLRPYGIGLSILLVAALGIFGVNSLIRNSSANQTTTPTFTQSLPTLTVTSVSPTRTQSVPTNTPTVAPTPVPTLGIGSTMISPKDGMTLLYVPAGEFTMGSEDGEDDEKPIHTVHLDVFWIDQTEVTNEQFVLFLNAEENQNLGNEIWSGVAVLDEDGPIQNVSGIWQVESEYGNHPVASVSWEGAQAYCEWANRRLLTEAEWEKAARGGLDGRAYPWGDERPSCDLGADNGAQYGQCRGGTVPVGSFSQNAYGLYDMAGNVMEWVADWYNPTYYQNSPSQNPLGPAEANPWNPGFQTPPRVLRGGGSDSLWSYFEEFLRVASRHVPDGATALNFIGFRCAMDASE
ncbi:MAG TPA: SUMF1/EgtB/PvdO family nonheme iron enzyme [Anaerolineales bacterium]|nr:SUMF1/EgtB/PvdO family nonheme iron enzyme [Anaerolineales bacterium]